ncbi:CgeB family protein [Alkaliphilus crotonatoxidans]
MRLLYLSTGIGWPFQWLDTAVNHGIIEGKIDGHALDIRNLPNQQEIVNFANAHQPKLIITMNSSALSLDIVTQLRRSGFRVALWCTDDPYDNDSSIRRARFFDLVFTTEIAAVPHYRSVGCRIVHYVPLGADTMHYKPMSVEPKYQSEICILGTAFDVRLAAVDYMASYLNSRNTLIVGNMWERLNHYPMLQNKVRSGVFDPNEAAKYYAGAQIVINIHRAFDCRYLNRNSRRIQGLSPNNRVFDVAATKTFQIISYRRDISKYLKNHVECEVAMNSNEIIALCDKYLRNNRIRDIAAEKAYKKVMTHYKMSDSLHNILNLAGV